MFKWILQRKKIEWKELLNGILYNTAVFSVFGICLNVILKLFHTKGSGWYQKAINEQLVKDSFYKEKAGLVIFVMILIFGIISFFCILALIFKTRMNLKRTDNIAAYLKVAGYQNGRIVIVLYIGELILFFPAGIFSIIFTMLLWNILVQRPEFSELFVLAGTETDYNYFMFFEGIVIMAVIVFLSVLFWNMEQNKKSLVKRL